MHHARHLLSAPGPPEALWIKVEAFGLNRSELHTRLGLAQGVTFPRVLGIEVAGVVAQCRVRSSRWGSRSSR
jgi:NADPH:quinone reductase-like Zn-dependent oxidoreductase